MQDRERKAAKQKGQHCYSALIGCRHSSIILRDYLKPEGSSVVEFLAGDMCFTADEREYWSTEG